MPASGIYNVVDRFGVYLDRQVVAREGESFPATRMESGEYGFELYIATEDLDGF